MPVKNDSDNTYDLIYKIHKAGFTNVELIVPSGGSRSNRWQNSYVFTSRQINQEVNLGFTKRECLQRLNSDFNRCHQEDYLSIEQWVKNDFTKGCSIGYGDNSNHIRLSWMSYDNKYGICSFKGRYEWSKIGETKYYASKHFLFKNDGKLYCSDAIHNKYFEGKLTKQIFYKLISLVKIQYELDNDFLPVIN